MQRGLWREPLLPPCLVRIAPVGRRRARVPGGLARPRENLSPIRGGRCTSEILLPRGCRLPRRDKLARARKPGPRARRLAQVLSRLPVSEVPQHGSGLCAPVQWPPGSWAAKISVPQCPADMSGPVRLPASLLLPHRLPGPGPVPPPLSHRGWGPASVRHSLPREPAPCCPLLLRKTLIQLDRSPQSLWRHCVRRNPSPDASVHAHSATSHTTLGCPIVRPATGPRSRACPWQLRRAAPSALHRPSKMPGGSGPRAGPRSPACAFPPACRRPPLHPVG